MSLQVYEHVYETVDINSSPEVRANATAKVDPHHIPSNKQVFDLYMFYLSQFHLKHHVKKVNREYFQKCKTVLFIHRLQWQLSQQVRDTHIHAL